MSIVTDDKPVRWTVRSDIPRRAYGLSKKEWQLIQQIDFVLCREVSNRLRTQRTKSPAEAADRAKSGERLFSFGELQVFVGGNPRTASLVAARLCRKGILRKFTVREARAFFGRRGLEVRAPRSAKRLYQFIPPAPDNPLIKADLPDMVAHYLAARILSGTENEGIAYEPSKYAPGRPLSNVIFVNPRTLRVLAKNSKEAVAFREFLRSAQRLMTAYTSKTIQPYPTTAGRAWVPSPDQWWWNMRAPLIVIDLSWPRYPFGASAYPLFLALEHSFYARLHSHRRPARAKGSEPSA